MACDSAEISSVLVIPSLSSDSSLVDLSLSLPMSVSVKRRQKTFLHSGIEPDTALHRNILKTMIFFYVVTFERH